MRKLQFWVSASLLVAAMATFTIFIGCEDEPGLSNAGAILDANGFENETRTDGEIPLFVSPTIDSVAVIGQRIAFRAKGAVNPVAWSVGSAVRGTISTVGLRTDYAIYESIAVADNTIVAIDASGRSATATIKVGADPLQIIPTDITLLRPPAGPAASLVVQGGVPPLQLVDRAVPRARRREPGRDLLCHEPDPDRHQYCHDQRCRRRHRLGDGVACPRSRYACHHSLQHLARHQQ